MDDRTPQAPPSDCNAEAGVLSAMIIDEQCLPKVITNISRDDFYHPPNALLFDAIYALYSNNMAIDPITLTNHLKETKTLDRVGGVSYINDITDFVVSSGNIDYHLGIIKKKTMLRNIITQTRVIQQQVYADGNPDDLLEHAGRIVREIMGTQKEVAQNINDVIDESLREFIAYADGKTPIKIKTGWSKHDRLIGGLGPGQLIIIGARPAMGKTQLAINLARKIGCAGHVVYIKSYEMSRLEIADRFVNMNSVGTTYFSKEKDKNPHEMNVEAVFSTYEATCEQMKNAHIIIDEQAGDDSVRLRSRLLQAKAKHGLGVVILDYLQLMPKNRDQQQARDPMAELCRSLKLLAKELGVPVIALSQLNRDSVKRSDKRPHLEDLRESGAIEQDADLVLLLHRDDYYVEESDSRGIMEVIAAKNRHGSTGIIKLFYDRSNGLMAEVDDWGREFYE